MDALQAKVIDEYGELDRQVREFAPIAAKHESLKKIIKAWCEEMPADEGAMLEGRQYKILVGARERERKFKSLSKVFKACGTLKRFLSVCTVAIGALEELIGKSQVESLVETTSTGTRRLRPIAKASPNITQAA